MDKFETIKSKLKEEFFGIDNAIDEVVNGFKLWETIKDYQTRPIIYNLWGLTGCGKTALVNRVIELLKLEPLVTNIKLNSKIDQLSEELGDNDLPQNIFVIDEFQHARTIDGGGYEIAREQDGELNIIWDLFDSGKVTMFGNFKPNLRYALNIDIDNLKLLSECGAKYENGIISHPNLQAKLKANFIENFDTFDEIAKKKNGIVDIDIEFDIDEDGIYDLDDELMYIKTTSNNDNNKNRVDNQSKTEIILKTLMRTFIRDIFELINDCNPIDNINTRESLGIYIDRMKSIDELITFLDSLLKTKPKPKIKDFSQSLIFVMGNLDECYGIANDLNSDLDADFFHKETMKINITDVKGSLLKRFRAEEIARLGSKHIIYPSLNKNAFKSVINKELNKFKDIVISRFEKHNNKFSNVTYSDNIHKIIYLEGVFPIQGTRCIFSVINDVIIDKFPTAIEYILELDTIESNKYNLTLSFDYDFRRKTIILKFINNIDDSILDTKIFKYTTQISDLRTENTSKGRQVHRAVHESGHAVCSLLNNVIPEVIYSVLLGDDDGGFNLFNETYYFRINNYMNHIVVSLGGYVAEELIFGRENISNGSSSDLDNATSQLMCLYKECGFHEGKLGIYTNQNIVSGLIKNQNSSITEDYFNTIVEDKIKECYDITKVFLTKQNTLLLKMSEYLSKHPKMDQKTIKKYVAKYAVDFDVKNLTNDMEQFYVDLFEEKLKLIQ